MTWYHFRLFISCEINLVRYKGNFMELALYLSAITGGTCRSLALSVRCAAQKPCSVCFCFFPLSCLVNTCIHCVFKVRSSICNYKKWEVLCKDSANLLSSSLRFKFIIVWLICAFSNERNENLGFSFFRVA